MKTIELILEPIIGHLISINRNTVNGWYELEIGIYKNWVYTPNNEIGIELISDNESGKVLKIFPKKPEIVVDDLVDFVELIIITNQKIADKEREFTEKMAEMKNELEQKAKKFYEELDEIREKSFKQLNNPNDNFETTKIYIDINRKPRKVKIPKVVSIYSGTT